MINNDQKRVTQIELYHMLHKHEMWLGGLEDSKQFNAENMDLSGLSFQRMRSLTNLKNARLKGANLPNAVLIGARLEGADLRDANLENADLTNSDMYCADVTGANLQGVKLEGAITHGIVGMDLELEKEVSKKATTHYERDTWTVLESFYADALKFCKSEEANVEHSYKERALLDVEYFANETDLIDQPTKERWLHEKRVGLGIVNPDKEMKKGKAVSAERE